VTNTQASFDGLMAVVIGKLFLSEILTEMPYLKGFSAKISDKKSCLTCLL
jgi:hypothetical protein